MALQQWDLEGAAAPVLLAMVGATDGVQILLQAGKQAPQLVRPEPAAAAAAGGADTWLTEHHVLLRCQMAVQLKLYGMKVRPRSHHALSHGSC